MFGYSEIKPAVKLDKWCVHAYYTICPWAPDESGRLLFAGADLKTKKSRLYIASAEGEIIDSFGENDCETTFWHTGRFQTWGPDGRTVYYQSGSAKHPRVVKRELATGREWSSSGDMEGASPQGEPVIGGAQGMLYAAGYGGGGYAPEKSPYPFGDRASHGIFRFNFETGKEELALSTAEILEVHPDRDRLMRTDKELQQKFGGNYGLTLMCAAVRWNMQGDRFLFYFGNHCQSRGEPRIAYIFTADKSFKDIKLALSLSYGAVGCHISWHPDGKRLIGYGPRPDKPSEYCLALVDYDGGNYHKISDHASGGHSSVNPSDYNMIVTDESVMVDGRKVGKLLFLDARTGKRTDEYLLSQANTSDEKLLRGRNPYRVCYHAVFDHDGSRILLNTLEGENAQLAEMSLKGRFR